MIVETRAAGPFMENGFLLGCERTREAVLVDPGDGVDALLADVERHGLRVLHILLTHAHVDHVTGVPVAKRALGVPIHLHRDDLFLYERAHQQAVMFGIHIEPLPPVDRFYSRGEVISFGDYRVHVHHTPGHCPGGVCLRVVKEGSAGDDLDDLDNLFVGDTLFAGSIGRTDLPGGDYETLINSIREVLFAFGDAARVYPGHGPATTIGQERRTNPFLT